MANLRNYVLTAEAAQILGVSQNTWRAWASDGRIPVRRNSAHGYRLFLRSDLQKFLAAASKVRPTSTSHRPAAWSTK